MAGSLNPQLGQNSAPGATSSPQDGQERWAGLLAVIPRLLCGWDTEGAEDPSGAMFTSMTANAK
jgi:hypothetical protein